jgi:hypothetical protein
MLTKTVFQVLVYGTRAQSLSAPFSYTCVEWVMSIFRAYALNVKASCHINSQIPLMVYTVCI